MKRPTSLAKSPIGIGFSARALPVSKLISRTVSRPGTRTSIQGEACRPARLRPDRRCPVVVVPPVSPDERSGAHRGPLRARASTVCTPGPSVPCRHGGGTGGTRCGAPSTDTGHVPRTLRAARVRARATGRPGGAAPGAPRRRRGHASAGDRGTAVRGVAGKALPREHQLGGVRRLARPVGQALGPPAHHLRVRPPTSAPRSRRAFSRGSYSAGAPGTTE